MGKPDQCHRPIGKQAKGIVSKWACTLVNKRPKPRVVFDTGWSKVAAGDGHGQSIRARSHKGFNYIWLIAPRQLSMHRAFGGKG
ncbi:MAG: hypothetical protein RIQ89_1051 [Bacteroidota bacterium]